MKKRVCILMGSPRKNGNTMQLLQPFMQQLQQSGCECELIWLYDKNIQPCRACRCCQKDHTIFGCAIRDDMPDIFDSVLQCDLLVLATPIYSWYCTPPMKSVLDRLVYGMNKILRRAKRPRAVGGKSPCTGNDLRLSARKRRRPVGKRHPALLQALAASICRHAGRA